MRARRRSARWSWRPCRPRAATRLPRTYETAEESVAAAPRSPRPSPSISAAASSIELGSATPWPAMSAAGPVVRPEDARALSGQPAPGEHAPRVEAPRELGERNEQRQRADDDVEDRRARGERADRASRRDVRDREAVAVVTRRGRGGLARPAVVAADERDLRRGSQRAAVSARSSVHSHASGWSGATNVTAAPWSRTRMTAARRSSSASSVSSSSRSIVAARIASAASAAFREARREGMPDPHGRVRAERHVLLVEPKPCNRAAALMPRLACAITSGPIPSPARQAIEYVVIARSPPEAARGWRRCCPRRHAP